MTVPIVVVVGALGAQGSGVVSAFTAQELSSQYHVRALTSNANSDSAKALVSKHSNVSVASVDLFSIESVQEAFKDATFIFANTIFHPETFMTQGGAATQKREETQGLNIVRAAAKVQSLKHLVYSTLPNSDVIGKGKYPIPHFQGKIAAEDFARSKENGLADKTTYLRIGMYACNPTRPPYQLIPVKTARKYVFMLPCSPDIPVPFIGDESADTGTIVRAIFQQPDKTFGRTVLGTSEYKSCRDWAAALEASLRQTQPDAMVSFVECTLQGYEELWGPFGTELGLMMRMFSEIEMGGWKEGTGAWPALTPEDLGVQAQLKTIKDRAAELKSEDLIIPS